MARPGNATVTVPWLKPVGTVAMPALPSRSIGALGRQIRGDVDVGDGARQQRVTYRAADIARGVRAERRHDARDVTFRHPGKRRQALDRCRAHGVGLGTTWPGTTFPSWTRGGT